MNAHTGIFPRMTAPMTDPGPAHGPLAADSGLVVGHRFAAAGSKLGQSMRCLLLGASLALAAAAPAHAAAENTGKTQQPLGIDKTVTLWTSMGNTIPVCWITPGFDREKRIVRQAVLDTWAYYAELNFTGWGNCPMQGNTQLVRVQIVNQGVANSGAGGAAMLGTAALSKAGDAANVTFSFNPDGSAKTQRVEYVGVHEFGHVLGFGHEQDLPGNVEGPEHCDTNGVDPNAVPVTAFDRNSVMNYCNADGNRQGRLTDVDILGVRSIYGTRTHFAASAVILLGDGQVWRSTGRPCNDKACPGWQLINNDARSQHIAASDSRLFARQRSGQIWVWDGHTPCTSKACPGWTLIDANTRSSQIVAAGNTLFQLQVDGKIWRWDGRTACTAAACPGWTLVDIDARITSIAASDSKLFARQATGQLWAWDGRTPCSGTACPGWALIDSTTRSIQMAAAGSTLYQLQVDGKVWQWDGRTPCSGTACPGWTLVNNDARIKTIAATATKLFARQGTGELWLWDGRTPCSSTACPGWTLIDSNKRSQQVAAGGDTLFQRHADGAIWRWDGKTACTALACPGWSLINREAQTIDMQAFVPVSEPSRLSSGALF